MKLMVCGHARHGKDTFCEMLGIPFKSSSIIALEKVIWPKWGHRRYETVDQCFSDRGNHRGMWHCLIKEYNNHDKTRLAKDIFAQCDVYCGIRSEREFYAAKEEGLFDLAIWVDAGRRLPPESSDSNQMASWMCDIVVDNNGDPKLLADKISRLRPFLVGNEKSLQREIVEWADSVFPNRTITNALTKMVMEEIPEYLMAQHDELELGDIGLLLHDISHLAGVDLHSAIRKKLEINKKRTWEHDPVTGLMHRTGKNRG